MIKNIIPWLYICIGVMAVTSLLWIGFLQVDYFGKAKVLGEITRHGGVYLYRDWEIDNLGKYTGTGEPPDSSMVAWLSGRDHKTGRIRGVKFERDYPATEIDAVLQLLLKEFSDLRVLGLESNCISDNELKTISGFSELRTLVLKDTSITDKGINNLLLLNKLRYLDVRDTQITQNGIALIETSLGLEQFSYDEKMQVMPAPSAADNGHKKLKGD